MTLVQLIVERGEEAVDELPKGLRENREAMAATIENNVRRLIIDEQPINPKYYEKMSELLDALIAQRRQKALDYKAYLAMIVELTLKVSRPEAGSTYPQGIESPPVRALYDNLEGVGALRGRERSEEGYGDPRREKAIAIDEAIQQVKKADWRGNRFKEREVRNAIRAEVDGNDALTNELFEIVKAQREY